MIPCLIYYESYNKLIDILNKYKVFNKIEDIFHDKYDVVSFLDDFKQHLKHKRYDKYERLINNMLKHHQCKLDKDKCKSYRNRNNFNQMMNEIEFAAYSLIIESLEVMKDLLRYHERGQIGNK